MIKRTPAGVFWVITGQMTKPTSNRLRLALVMGRTYAMEGFGEAPRGYPASPKSLFWAAGWRLCGQPAAQERILGGTWSLQTSRSACDRVRRAIYKTLPQVRNA